MEVVAHSQEEGARNLEEEAHSQVGVGHSQEEGDRSHEEMEARMVLVGAVHSLAGEEGVHSLEGGHRIQEAQQGSLEWPCVV